MLLPLAYCFPEHVAPPEHTASCVVCAACPHSIMVDCIVFGPLEEEGNKNPEPFPPPQACCSPMHAAVPWAMMGMLLRQK